MSEKFDRASMKALFCDEAKQYLTYPCHVGIICHRPERERL